MTRVEELENMLRELLDFHAQRGCFDETEAGISARARKLIEGAKVKCPCGCQWTSDTEDDLQFHLKTAHSRFEISDAIRDGHLVTNDTDSLYHLPK